MAKSKVVSKFQTSIQGILDIADDGNLIVEVEDIGKPFVLSELFKDYKDKTVKISITYDEGIENTSGEDE